MTVMKMWCVKHVTSLNVGVCYLDEKLTARYQQRGYIPKVLQNSKRSPGQENKCEKTKLIFFWFWMQVM
jgi:hypothetical protein